MSALVAVSDPLLGFEAEPKPLIHELIHNYANLSLLHQSLGSLGEPKYNIDGSVFTGPWGSSKNQD
jgi:hypothetical protein